MRFAFLCFTFICTSASASQLVFKLVDSATQKNIAVLYESQKKVAYERLGQKCVLKIGTIKKQAKSYRVVEVREECKSESGATYTKVTCNDSALDEQPFKKAFSGKKKSSKKGVSLQNVTITTSDGKPAPNVKLVSSDEEMNTNATTGEVDFSETLRPQWDAAGCQLLSNSTMTVNGVKHRTDTLCCRE